MCQLMRTNENKVSKVTKYMSVRARGVHVSEHFFNLTSNETDPQLIRFLRYIFFGKLKVS